ncbi:long-chain-fatty-acid--CoA ligase [Hamadaea tsunoensis]|uniref:long-chain-fatty-acid--CoA ligase n=1 Tax=Hamadaea tsunoensis TaxID=53368 RepID=UPI000408F039|nr:long-chain fatty acid--CoA ligase [Hamadaea tsunoensis]
MPNLARNLAATAERLPGNVAVRLDDLAVTYADLAAQARSTAGALRELGVRPGDRVGLMLPNLPAFPALYYGILWAGGVVVPMNPLLKSREIEYYLSDSGSRILITYADAATEAKTGADAAGTTLLIAHPVTGIEAGGEPAGDVTERDDEDTAVILYTSGTTGRPKGAELTHANLGRNAEVAARTLFELTSDDVIMGCLPLFHSFGQSCGMNTAVLAGAALTLIPRFDPAKALQVIGRDRVTIFEGVPTMYAAMLHHPDRAQADLSSLRLSASGGSALPVEILHGFEQAFGAAILEGYGLSETSPVASFNHPDKPRKPGSIGTPIEGVEMKLVDLDGSDIPAGPGPDGDPDGLSPVGEIAIRGHNIMKGYWRNPEATEQSIPDGWFRSGDLARQDADGYYFIVDRKKDLIIRGGLNVYPREVEEVLYEHPAVAEAAVVGMPHATLGEEIGAAVALKPGASATPEELSAFVKERIAPYKYPRRVWIVEALPKTSTGKILRREVSAPEA